MNLYLMRHGDATGVGGIITRDAERTLSERGAREVDAMARLLADTDPSIGLVLTSPLLRSVQTGEVMSKHLPMKPAVRSTDRLSPGFRPEELLEELLTARCESLVAVGHQPDMSGFISYVISKSDASVEMQPCSVAYIELTPHSAHRNARLRWLISPKLQQAQERAFVRGLS